ncbi:MAG: 2OG-Fe dioxygenase family protein [Candidatus Eremiobacteraeota bacterium]|nr:2OG-Fe dioxygenase family protein [Candidatus Eremiobacteraeota bacterium]
MRVESLQGGYLPFPASQVRASLSELSQNELESVSESFSRLVQDRQMGDGGRYRYRRFSRFTANLRADGLHLEPLQNRSIRQSLEDNPLNGGVTRTFEPLAPELIQGNFLPDLIEHDVRAIQAFDDLLFRAPVVVGVHQVRIVAWPETQGKPTPEGVHRDAEQYTFQHFWQRSGIEGGEFAAYDENKNQVFRWLQTELLDSVLFTGTTWHSASPISCSQKSEGGYRDIFLIDFNPISS